MELYAPSYYKRFKCIADKCQNSCCVNWEIDIDDASYEKYCSLDDSIGESITEEDGVRCFKLSEDGRCPHLNPSGLCDIIIKYGEDYLTDICREHPRFYNLWDGRAEVGIGLVCEEAARLIITSDERFSLEKIGETEAFSEKPECMREQRDSVISFVLDADGGIDAKLSLLEQKYSFSLDIHTVPEWLELLSGLEILDGEWKRRIDGASVLPKIHNANDLGREFENLLIYFIFRHVSSADSLLNLRSEVAFSALSVKIIKYLFERSEEPKLQALISVARLYSSEIEYSEDNTAELIFELESSMI